MKARLLSRATGIFLVCTLFSQTLSAQTEKTGDRLATFKCTGDGSLYLYVSGKGTFCIHWAKGGTDYSKDGVLRTEIITKDYSESAWIEGVSEDAQIHTIRTSLNSYTDTARLTALDVSKCTELTCLVWPHNRLSSLDLSNNIALTELDCSNSRLSSLDLSNNTTLTTLNCSNNQLKDLNVSKNTALKTLDCSGNQLKKLELSKNTALSFLYCSNNQLTSLNLSKNTALSFLYCSDNQLTSLDLSKNAALTRLYCSGNQLTSLDLSKNAALTRLYCSGNQLTSLDPSKNTALTELDCSNNSIPLSTLYELLSQYSYPKFSFSDQSDSITLEIGETLDLSSERIIGQAFSEYKVYDIYDKVTYSTYTERDFIFSFKEPILHKINLRNPFSQKTSFTWYVTVVEKTHCSVQVASNNIEWGTVSKTGNGTYKEGEQVTITATPHAGYRFINWIRKDGSVFSTKAVHTFTVTEDIELTAVFGVETFTVALVANPNEGGRTSQFGNGTYNRGSKATIMATPNEGYRFVNWTKTNGSVFSTEAVYTFTVTEDLNLIANFEQQSLDNLNNEHLALKIHPNPSQGEFQIELPEPAQIEVYSSIGRLLQRKQAQTGTFYMNLENGVYYLRMIMPGGVVVRKLVVL